MFRRGIFLIAIVAIASVPIRANPADGDPRLEKLFLMFISPCCWRENLLVHDSPKANELRAEIKRLVAGGMSDGQIKTELVERYSIRILSMPEGLPGQFLWWTPLVALTAGFGAVIYTIRRLKGPASVMPPGDVRAIPDSEWDWDAPQVADNGRRRPA